MRNSLRPALAALGLAVLALGLAACPRKADDKQDPNVVATVNGESISRADFELELSRELPSIESDGVRSPEQVDPLKRSTLDTLIERTLLLQVARANNVTVTPEEVDREVLRSSSDYPAENFNEALAQKQMSMAELKQRTAAQLLIGKLFQGQVYPRVAVTEEEIRRYFDEHAAEFQEPEKVHAAQIVVKELDEAKRLQAQLKAGKKFSDLARKYSLSADAKVGGDLGFFARGEMPPQFDEVAFKLGINQISDVVSTEYGFHLFKVLEKKPARKRDLAEVRDEVERRLLKDKRAAAEKEFVKALRDKARIKVNDQVLATVTGERQVGSPPAGEP